MTFQIGDVIQCVIGKTNSAGRKILIEGQTYKVLKTKTEDGKDFVTVTSSTGFVLDFFANRFELADKVTPPVIRKIRLMEQRFKTKQESKSDYNLAA